jgi:nitrous oxidase accessory protein
MFDVTTNSRSSYRNVFERNYWDAYRGYDLNHNGVGDVPFRPVRFFSILIEQHRPAMILVRSLLSRALDAAERAFPALTPAAVLDEQPLMTPPGANP